MSDTELQSSAAEEETVEEKVSNWPSPGQKLQKLREEMGLSHGRVADALHMTAHYVKALESDEYDKLPGKTFVKGYIRSYAKLLGTNVDDIMSCYDKYVAALEESVESEASVMRAKKAYDQNLRWMICAAVIIVVVVGVSWWLASRQETVADMADTRSNNVAEVSASEDEAVTAEVLIATLEDSKQETGAGIEIIETVETVETAEEGMALETTSLQSIVMQDSEMATQPDPEVSAAVTENGVQVELDAGLDNQIEQALELDSSSPSMEDNEAAGVPEYTVTEEGNNRMVQLESEGSDLLQIHFSGASWIEVDNGDNTRLYNDMLGSGDDLTIRGQAPFNILIGDANVVEMTFNSETVDVTQRIRTDNSARLILESETR